MIIIQHYVNNWIFPLQNMDLGKAYEMIIRNAFFFSSSVFFFNNIVQCVSGVRQDAMPQSSTSAVFTQLAACLHSLHDAIKGEQRCEPLLTSRHSRPT